MVMFTFSLSLWNCGVLCTRWGTCQEINEDWDNRSEGLSIIPGMFLVSILIYCYYQDNPYLKSKMLTYKDLQKNFYPRVDRECSLIECLRQGNFVNAFLSLIHTWVQNKNQNLLCVYLGKVLYEAPLKNAIRYKYSHNVVTIGDWFQGPHEHQNLQMLKSNICTLSVNISCRL